MRPPIRWQITTVAAGPGLRRLSARQREIIVLHYIVELSSDEVALSLDCSLGTLKNHAHRARVRLRIHLGIEENMDLASDPREGGDENAEPN